jgi:hypothetical protein
VVQFDEKYNEIFSKFKNFITDSSKNPEFLKKNTAVIPKPTNIEVNYDNYGLKGCSDREIERKLRKMKKEEVEGYRAACEYVDRVNKRSIEEYQEKVKMSEFVFDHEKLDLYVEDKINWIKINTGVKIVAFSNLNKEEVSIKTLDDSRVNRLYCLKLFAEALNCSKDIKKINNYFREQAYDFKSGILKNRDALSIKKEFLFNDSIPRVSNDKLLKKEKNLILVRVKNNYDVVIKEKIREVSKLQKRGMKEGEDGDKRKSTETKEKVEQLKPKEYYIDCLLNSKYPDYLTDKAIRESKDMNHFKELNRIMSKNKKVVIKILKG